MLIAFFDVHGIVHAEFLPQGLTINSTSTKTSCDVWCAQWERKEENCAKRGHGCFIMTVLQLIMPWKFRSFLPKITLLYWSNHPTLQMWPCDFFLFPKLKEVFKGTRFQDSKATKTAVTRELWAITEESFQESVEAWQRRLEKCIRAQGDYFAGDML